MLIRCTCIHRPASADERAAGLAALVVETADPWCPAAAAHARAQAAAHGPRPVRREG
ncbi:MAG: hypothetical protein ACTHMS_04035 [Jatrophihabitans sp.]|uniref:hypothetical protein n=1 Tax=Jatrophihabitans sp. TaxID=1932789 RepID=UPI003F8169AE